MARTFQVDSDQLQRVSALFEANAALMEEVSGDLVRTSDMLRTGWKGETATAFFKDMDERILPILQSLTTRFRTSDQHTQTLIKRTREAEDTIKQHIMGHS